MATVILGGGIIGTATAFYLSELVSDPSSIHIVESSPTLYSGASGWAGGFLAKDWFSPSVSRLGALSFRLHKELAEQYDGAQNWGYLPSIPLSLSIDEDVGVGRAQGGDWLSQDESRATVTEGRGALNPDGSPAWLVQQKAGSLEVISSDGCAALDPSKLCHFLLSECQKRGVQLHQPAAATSIEVDKDTHTLKSITISPTSQQSTNTPPTDLSPTTLPLKTLILTAGPWTPTVFRNLFPSSKYKIPITSLAGHSLTLRCARYRPPFPSSSSPPTAHAIFSAPSPTSSIPFAPELFSRATGEIYISGVNSASKPLPSVATDKPIDASAVEQLKSAAMALMSHTQIPIDTTHAPGGEKDPDLTIDKIGLCWRPVTPNGTPLIGRIPNEKLGDDTKGDVFLAAGHGPWGISLSLGTGKVVAEMVLEKDVAATVGELGIED